MILFGPILARELIGVARRPRTYRRRVTIALLVLLAIGGNYLGWYYWNGEQFSIRQMALFAQMTFALLVTIQALLTIIIVPELVARVIAEEKERRSLECLLSTPLSSREIILGKLAAGLLQYVAFLAVGLPIMGLMVLLGGIDPRLVPLAYAGMLSTALGLAGLSILVSTEANCGRDATRLAMILGAAWIFLPMPIDFVLPRVWPLVYPWIRPINQWARASSPLAVLANLVGSPGGLLETVGLMILLQVAVGGLCIGLATVRLRSAWRGAPADPKRTRRRQEARPPARLWPRPACGDDPVLWKEMHCSRRGRSARLLGPIVFLGVVGLIFYETLDFARPSFAECWAFGYGASAMNDRRMQFNEGLRTVTGWLVFLLMLLVAGTASEVLASERARDTWINLISTPLSGREILRGKMLGVAWKMRHIATFLVPLWMVGLLCGAVHPLGFIIAVTELGAAIWFLVALGTYISLKARDLPQATTWTLSLTLLLSLSFLVCFLPPPRGSFLLGSFSTPWVEAWSLFSYAEVQDAFHPALARGNRMRFWREGPLVVLEACLIGIVSKVALAMLVTRLAATQFDAAVGRPRRSARPRESVMEGRGRLLVPSAP